MKDFLKKADLLGLILAAGALVLYWRGGIWTVYHTLGVALGGLLVVIALALKAGEIQTSLGRRSTKFGIHSFSSVALVLGILALVNYLGAQHFKLVDMTSEQIHTLSDQSIQLLDQIKQDVSVKAFYQGGEAENPAARDSLRRYTARNAKITVEFIDLEKHPDVAKLYEITAEGTLIIEMGGNKERIQKARFVEEDVTNALTKLVKGGKKTIYFVEGHGERQIADTGKNGFKQAGDKLAAENYTVKALNLARDGKVPADAAAVVVGGPTSEPFQAEVDALDAYVSAGGSALILLDPPPDTAALNDFAKKWSVDVGMNMVIDNSLVSRLNGTSPVWALVQDYGTQRITEQFRGQYTFFPQSRSITPAKPPVEGLTVEPLLKTSPESWGETDFKSIGSGKVTLDAKSDVLGPVSLGVVVTKDLGENKKSRLVFIGDSDFATNAYFSQQLNGDLFANAVSWLSQDESFITIRAKDPQNRPVTMTEAQKNMFSFASVLLFPGGILLAGIFVWASRR